MSKEIRLVPKTKPVQKELKLGGIVIYSLQDQQPVNEENALVADFLAHHQYKY